MMPHIAIKSDLFAAESRVPKIDSLGDPLDAIHKPHAIQGLGLVVVVSRKLTI